MNFGFVFISVEYYKQGNKVCNYYTFIMYYVLYQYKIPSYPFLLSFLNHLDILNYYATSSGFKFPHVISH